MAERCCPYCQSSSVSRSRRKGLFEKLLLPVFRRRPYRCQRCDHRFYAVMGTAESSPARDKKPPLAA